MGPHCLRVHRAHGTVACVVGLRMCLLDASTVQVRAAFAARSSVLPVVRSLFFCNRQGVMGWA